MRANYLREYPRTKIDELGRSRDDCRGNKAAARANQPATPLKDTVNRCRGQEGKRCGDKRLVDRRSVPDQPRQLEKSRDCAWKQPRSDAKLKFPRHQAIAVNEP